MSQQHRGLVVIVGSRVNKVPSVRTADRAVVVESRPRASKARLVCAAATVQIAKEKNQSLSKAIASNNNGNAEDHVVRQRAGTVSLAVVGSRGFEDEGLINDVLSSVCQEYNVGRIVSGGATGPDTIGASYARAHDMPILIHRPDWSTGRHAGLVRNSQIVADSDVILAFWDGTSRGTKDSITKARKAGKKVIIVKPSGCILRDQ